MGKSSVSDIDPTNGRWLLPVKDIELAMDKDPNIQTRRRRVYMSANWGKRGGSRIGGDDVTLTLDDLKNASCDQWIYYKTLECTSSGISAAKSRQVDVLYVHGYSVYGGILAYDVAFALQAGFRVHLLDMPSHGRSTGLMAHIPQIDMLPDAVRAVIADVAECDCLGPGTARPFFLTGMSLGGLTVLLASMRHESDVTDLHDRLLGTYALCPVIGMVDSPPNRFVLAAGKALAPLIGKRPLLGPPKGVPDNLSDNPDLWKAMVNDPMVYTEGMQLTSALAFVKGMEQLESYAANFGTPVRIVHGSLDRNTSHIASSRFIERCGSTDKSYRSFPVEHAMVRVIAGKVLDSDKAANEEVLYDWVKWMLDRVPT